MNQLQEKASAYDFFTSSGLTRPVKLKESTRKFAYESLYDHKYGLDARKTPRVPVMIKCLHWNSIMRHLLRS